MVKKRHGLFVVLYTAAICSACNAGQLTGNSKSTSQSEASEEAEGGKSDTTKTEGSHPEEASEACTPDYSGDGDLQSKSLVGDWLTGRGGHQSPFAYFTLVIPTADKKINVNGLLSRWSFKDGAAIPAEFEVPVPVDEEINLITFQELQDKFKAANSDSASDSKAGDFNVFSAKGNSDEHIGGSIKFIKAPQVLAGGKILLNIYIKLDANAIGSSLEGTLKARLCWPSE